MAQKYYNVRETAEILGLPEDDVKQMQASRQLHGYRDGIDWKFKVEDIDRLAGERAAGPSNLSDSEPSDPGDVLLSEVELGESDPGASGTVIGMESGAKSSADSDLKIADDDFQLADSGLNLADEPQPAGASATDEGGSKAGQFEDLDNELDLTLEEDLSLDEDLALDEGPAEVAAGDSDVGLDGSQFEDDDLVLGGSGGGSDISIGGDSGISLVDPADSGLSLEEPLELVSSSEESLELGEDDMLSLSDDGNAAGAAEEDDFLLTPLEEAGDEDDSESGSQVIALDTEGEPDEAATMIASSEGGGMAAMLEEDLGDGSDVADFGAPLGADAAPLGAQPAGLAVGQPATQAAAIAPEIPYSVWNVLSLALCAIFLTLTGMMMYDLLRNMWSWDSTYQVNSSIMDWILSLFE
ncbi:MAG: helix-turn-helix domain-containing protein [Thermoguttaceae bacterium]